MAGRCRPPIRAGCSGHSNPDAELRRWYFGPSLAGRVIYLIAEKQQEVHVLLVQWLSRRTTTPAVPLHEMWANSRLETLLAQKFYLTAVHGLR